jgi:hypothetical protein
MALRQVEILSPVEEFFRENRQGRRRLLALTYEFDPAAFERAFAKVLTWPIQVDVVAGKGCEGSTTRARFWRACWPGTFHPKMICLLANTHVAVGLGSANLTSGGLGENLEIWRYFEGQEDHVVLGGVRDLLKRLDERHVFPRAVAIEEFIEAMPTSKVPHALLTTLHGSLLPQVVSRVGRSVRHVDMVTPINCDPTDVIKRLRHNVGGEEYRLYTDKEPVPYIQGITKSYSLERPERDEHREGVRAVSLAHAKIYAFDGDKNVDLFWGSANLSYSAWLARGKRANADFLVHTRTSSKEWSLLRDKSLPIGHKWKIAPVKGKPPREPVERESRWQLLHAFVQNDEVWLEANRLGSVHLLLKEDISSRPLKCSLSFMACGACLPAKVRAGLGFGRDHAPKFLWWSVASGRKWFKIPVNRLDLVGEDRSTADLAQQLFWEFTGRLLPRPVRSPEAPSLKKKPPHPPDVSADEDELTKSEHQGDLDRFVLEWRAIARRVAQSCGANDALRRHRIASIMKRIDLDSRPSLKNWPKFKRDFVRQLLERPWRA